MVDDLNDSIPSHRLFLSPSPNPSAPEMAAGDGGHSDPERERRDLVGDPGSRSRWELLRFLLVSWELRRCPRWGVPDFRLDLFAIIFEFSGDSTGRDLASPEQLLLSRFPAAFGQLPMLRFLGDDLPSHAFGNRRDLRMRNQLHVLPESPRSISGFGFAAPESLD